MFQFRIFYVIEWHFPTSLRRQDWVFSFLATYRISKGQTLLEHSLVNVEPRNTCWPQRCPLSLPIFYWQVTTFFPTWALLPPISNQQLLPQWTSFVLRIYSFKFYYCTISHDRQFFCVYNVMIFKVRMSIMEWKINGGEVKLGRKWGQDLKSPDKIPLLSRTSQGEVKKTWTCPRKLERLTTI